MIEQVGCAAAQAAPEGGLDALLLRGEVAGGAGQGHGGGEGAPMVYFLELSIV